MHDLCLLLVGIFCGPRASEVMGMQWKSWNGESLTPHGTAVEGQALRGSIQDKAESSADRGAGAGSSGHREAGDRLCADSSPEALMFPTFGRGKRKGQAVPRTGKNFLTWRVRPIAVSWESQTTSSPFRSCDGLGYGLCRITEHSKTLRAYYAMPASRQPVTCMSRRLSRAFCEQ